MGAAEIRAFLLHVARECGRSAATVNVYAGALRFLYGVTLARPEEMARIPRMRVPMRVPVVLSGTEVARLLAAIRSERHLVAAMLAYGAGLRVGEVCKLRIDDVDPKRMVLRIRGSSADAGRATTLWKFRAARIHRTKCSFRACEWESRFHVRRPRSDWDISCR